MLISASHNYAPNKIKAWPLTFLRPQPIFWKLFPHLNSTGRTNVQPVIWKCCDWAIIPKMIWMETRLFLKKKQIFSFGSSLRDWRTAPPPSYLQEAVQCHQ